jgi:uncharacterized protein (DUF433 family)
MGSWHRMIQRRILPWQRWIGHNVLRWKASRAKVSGAWLFKGTRMPVAIVFQNLEAGASIEEIMEWFDLTREQITTVLDFAARSLEALVPR